MACSIIYIDTLPVIVFLQLFVLVKEDGIKLLQMYFLSIHNCKPAKNVNTGIEERQTRRNSYLKNRRFNCYICVLWGDREQPLDLCGLFSVS